jgi:hypothetical protein
LAFFCLKENQHEDARVRVERANDFIQRSKRGELTAAELLDRDRAVGGRTATGNVPPPPFSLQEAALEQPKVVRVGPLIGRMGSFPALAAAATPGCWKVTGVASAGGFTRTLVLARSAKLALAAFGIPSPQ